MGALGKWKSYLIPGAQTLRNKFVSEAEPYGVADPRLLEQLERRFSLTRVLALVQHPHRGELRLRPYEGHPYAREEARQNGTPPKFQGLSLIHI